MRGKQEKMRAQPEHPMSYRRACEDFGAGDFQRGQQIFFMLAKRLEEARQKHPLFAIGPYQALGVIGSEYRELVRAVEHETPDRQLDENLDLAVVNIRMINGEHKIKRRKRG